MDISLTIDNFPVFLEGLWNTIWLVGASLIVGGVLAIPLSLMQAYKVPIVGKLSYGFAYMFRGTPLLVQVYIIYYGLSQFQAVRSSFLWPVLKDPYLCALIGFSLNSAAYVSEILRGAIANMPTGVIEAAYACGMSKAKMIRRIVLPIAFRRSIYAYSNEVIFMLHGSVIASTITIVDVLGAGRRLNSQYYVTYEGFVTAAVLYMSIVFVVTLVFRFIENRYAIKN